VEEWEEGCGGVEHWWGEGDGRGVVETYAEGVVELGGGQVGVE
jgi:hypothetical protein